MAMPLPFQEFMSKLRFYCENPVKEADGLSCRLKKNTYKDPINFADFLDFLHSHNEEFPKYHVKFDMQELTVNLGAAFFHAGRLAKFFHKALLQEDIVESMQYLLALGWTEEDFAKIGVSHSSFFRYLKKAQVVASEPTEDK